MMELRDGEISRHTIDYSDYDLPKATLDDLKGGCLEENVAITRGILGGTLTGPKRDVVVLNAAAAIMLAGIAPGMTQAIAAAGESIDSGRAKTVLAKMAAISHD